MAMMMARLLMVSAAGLTAAAAVPQEPGRAPDVGPLEPFKRYGRGDTQCTFPLHPQEHIPFIRSYEYTCLNENITLKDRRDLLFHQEPYDQINGVRLDDIQPALAATTWKIGDDVMGAGRTVQSAFEYQGATYAGFMVERAAGYRAPIHYHEVPQLLCLVEGSVEVWMEGQTPKIYTAPDCYMMPAYTKVCPLTLKKKKEYALLRVPKGGYDWIVLEEKYHDMQTQWKTEVPTGSGLNPNVPVAVSVSTSM